MSTRRAACAAPLLAALAACGGERTGAEGTTSARGAGQSTQSAGGAAAPGPKADCQAVSAAEPAADGSAAASATDVLGVRPGQTYDEAYALLACNEAFTRVEVAGPYLDMRTYDLPVRPVLAASDGRPCAEGDGPTQAEWVRRGMRDDEPCWSRGRFAEGYVEMTDEAYVVLTGLEGEEVVQAVFRTKTYPEGGQPPLGALRDRLVAKYGEPSEEAEGTRYGQHVTLQWKSDTRGRPMSPSHPAYTVCGLQPDIDRGQSWRADCGVTIGATLYAGQNPLLVREMHVAVMDQNGLIEGGEAMAADLKARWETGQAEAAEAAAGMAAEVDL